MEKYRKILGKEQFKELTRAIGLKANGVGIGSFVYLRRIFENLIEEASKKAQSEIKEFSEEKYKNSRMDDKIILVKAYLPDFLVDNRKLYVIFSTGIHKLSEQECLLYFETVKVGIEQILDEKITQIERTAKLKESEKEIGKVLSKLKNS